MLATLLPRASAQLWRHSLALLQSTASTQTCAGRRELRPFHTLRELLAYKIWLNNYPVFFFYRRSPTACRQHLSRHARGIKRWEEVAQSRAEVNRQQEEEEEKAGMDFGTYAVQLAPALGGVELLQHRWPDYLRECGQRD